jgi:hypothetical protein
MTDDVPSWLSEAMHALIIDRERSLQELLTAYDALEERAVRFLSGEPNRKRRIEVQRRLASLRLGAAQDRAGSAQDARKLFDRCEQLGYTYAWQRVTAAAIFTRLCLDDGHPELERGELDSALESVPRGTFPSAENLAQVLDAAKRRE